MDRNERDAGLALACFILGVVILSWIFSGCEYVGTVGTPQLPASDAGLEADAEACLPSLLPCPGNPDEALPCGCGRPCGQAELEAWCSP